ncbi:MAG: DUF4832 domain-containing protein [Lachnospiraceae bacterium]|nr:DUF4832 domain-containing protein [Lachnospiraceae bacterium]
MIRLLKKLNRYRAFHKAELKETVDSMVNPARGWFSLYSFELDKDPEGFMRECELDSKNSLVLFLVDIAAYRDGIIEDADLKKLEKLLLFFREHGKDIILRVTYDHEGKGMHREPLYFDKVRGHAAKIAEFVSDHHKEIFLYQGLLIGKWGEMHTSRFASHENFQVLYEIFERNLNNPVFMAVRKPVQLRWLKGQPEKDVIFDPGYLGVFNDGMFGSDSDLGTYDGDNKDGAWHKSWTREKEQTFIGDIALKIPCGGEALFGESFIQRHGAETILDELKRQHITYLNKKHDRKLISYWKKHKTDVKGIWNGSSYYDYIGAHLGYRFLVKKVNALKKKTGCELKVTIENKGFAPIFVNTELYVCITDNGGKAQRIIAKAGRLDDIAPGNRFEFSFTVPATKGKVFLYACDKNTGRTIAFANQGMNPAGLLLGNMI